MNFCQKWTWHAENHCKSLKILNKLLVVLTIYCYILDIKLTHVYTPGPTGHIRLYSISYNNNNVCFTKYNYNNITKY